jgi:putative membrane protein
MYPLFFSNNQKLFAGMFNNKEEIILRDYLALERTRLANERTLLAYSRTSLVMLIGGLTFLQLESFRTIKWAGYLALGLSVALIFAGFFRYFQIRARLSRYYRRGINEVNQSDHLLSTDQRPGPL